MFVAIDTNIFLNVAREEERFLKGSEELLRKIRVGRIDGLASCAVLMETKWALYEKKEYAKAEKVVSLIEDIIKIVSIDKEIAKDAIDLKIERKTELLDSIHVITAAMNRAVFVTRDDELRRKVEDIVIVKTPEEILKEAT